MKRLSLAILLALPCCMASAQQLPSVLPVPSQVVAAKTIFIAPAGIDSAGTLEPQFKADVYSSIASAIAGTHRFVLKAAPADADISLRISFKGLTSTARTFYFLQLQVFDPHTGMLLWGLEEEVLPANRQVTFLKNVDKAAQQLAASLLSLAEGKAP